LSVKFPHLLISAAKVGVLTCFMSTAGFAQGIEVGQLGQAQSYMPGTLGPVDGALGENLWTGTQAGTAKTLIEKLPDDYTYAASRDLVRSVLLSPGVPPQGDTNNLFAGARMNGIIRLSETSAAQDIAQRSPGLTASDVLKADLALLAGDLSTACQQSDSIIEGRTEIYWMKLRAFCHVERGEGAAADLTLDLLRNAGHSDPYFERLMRHMTGVPGAPDLKDIPGSPLLIAMIGKAGLSWPDGRRPAIAAAQSVYNVNLDPNSRLLALMEAAPALSNAQITEIIDSLQSQGVTPDAGLVGGVIGLPATPNLDTALADKGARGFSQLFTLSQIGGSDERGRAVAELLVRADTAGVFPRFVDLLSSQLTGLNYSNMDKASLALIAKAAILRNDLGALQQIYQTLEGSPLMQERIALSADALGNGFFGGNLGTDIDGRLTRPGQKQRAFRDAMLAHALGAALSDTAFTVLSQKPSLGRYSGDLFALQAASGKRAQAETALRAALIMENSARAALSDFEIYMVVDALYQSGLTDQAAKIAALDFITDIAE